MPGDNSASAPASASAGPSRAAPSPTVAPTAGPAAAHALPHVGGDRPPRFQNPKEMEAYYANLAKTPYGPPSPRFARAFTVFTWGLGAFTIGYMVLFADFGKKEHVFSPLRREVAKYTSGWTTLSESERDMLGLNKKVEGAAPQTQKQT